jgi:hypothetical protein
MTRATLAVFASHVVAPRLVFAAFGALVVVRSIAFAVAPLVAVRL